MTSVEHLGEAPRRCSSEEGAHGSGEAVLYLNLVHIEDTLPLYNEATTGEMKEPVGGYGGSKK